MLEFFIETPFVAWYNKSINRRNPKGDDGMKQFVGVDIGGTKCAVSLGYMDGTDLKITKKEKTETPKGLAPERVLEMLADMVSQIVSPEEIAAIGISCGGPLDSKRGVILSPPNLIGWDHVEITDFFEKRFHVPCALQNDANACALAEWRFGAGRGTENMVFFTFGTGLGAGLILNGKLYSGTNDMAGEAGHIRLAEFGPSGYGKVGSFEGFCSGSGIAQLAKTKALEAFQQGKQVSFCKNADVLDSITAKGVADAANAGDELALEIYRLCGTYLGRGLSVIIDILNPERIVIGSIYTRCEHLLKDACEQVIKKECLPHTASVCEIVPAELSEQIGDYAALAVAVDATN